MTKEKHISDVTQKDYDYVSLLLKEAARYGLEVEVETFAKKYINEGYGFVVSFEMAYDEWIK